MTTTASWIGLCASLAPAGKPNLRDTSTSTQSTTGKKARTAFDGPGITINSAASRRDTEKRFGMRWSRI